MARVNVREHHRARISALLYYLPSPLGLARHQLWFVVFDTQLGINHYALVRYKLAKKPISAKKYLTFQ